jgi:hypothetical protein
MTINDERPLDVWKFKDLVPGDVFEFKEIIYIKAVSGEYNKYYNVFNLTQNILNHIDDGTFVVKLDCELNIKG